MNAKKQPWSKAEKLLLGSVFVIIGLGIAVAVGFRQLRPVTDYIVPTPAMPYPNAFDYFVAAGNQLRDTAKIDAASLPPLHPGAKGNTVSSLRQKAALVRENAAALKTLRQGFAYPYQPPPVRSINVRDLYPYSVPERRLARLLAFESQVKAARGDWAGAVNSGLDTVQEGTQIPHGSVLIGKLVGLACQAIGRRHLWPDVDHLSAAQARAAAHRLEKIQASSLPFAQTLQEEEWFGQAAMQELFRGPRAVLNRLPFFLKHRYIHDYTRYMDQSIANARRPYAAKPPVPAVPGDFVNALFLLDASVLPQARIEDTYNCTQNALLTVALALYAYKMEHGASPSTLDALVPSYLTHVPDDPFALNDPLRYRRAGAKYRLYSVGPDGRDDGGRPIFHQPTAKGSGAQRSRYGVQEDSLGDIVAGVNP